MLISAQAVSSPAQSRADRSLLSVKNILKFADCANLDDVRDLLNRQVLYNCAISAVGIAYMLDKPLGEGLVKDDVESTIQSIGRMGRVGMHETDIEILNIMLGK